MEFFCLECADVIEILDPERQIQVIHFVSVKKLQKHEAKTLCQLKFYTFKISFKTQKCLNILPETHNILFINQVALLKQKKGPAFAPPKTPL